MISLVQMRFTGVSRRTRPPSSELVDMKVLTYGVLYTSKTK
jgi:hypothetical protein